MEDFAINLWTNLYNLLEWSYLVAVILLDWIVLKYALKKSIKTTKFITTIINGLILGTLWYLLFKTSYDKLIVTFLSSVAFYEWFAKWLMKKLKLEYEKEAPKKELLNG